MVLLPESSYATDNPLAALPEVEGDADIKIVAVTSPELLEQLRRRDPAEAECIFGADERARAMAFHSG